MSLKRRALNTFASSPLPALFQGLTRGAAAIFMMHRFADPISGVEGHDPALLRGQLEWLRARKYRIAPLADVVRDLSEDPSRLRRTVVFTVDDGYDDFRRIGWPVLAEFDCPATVFLTSDFTDGRMWFWWDRIEFALSSMEGRSCRIAWRGREERLTWGTDAQRAPVLSELVERLKEVPEAERLDVLAQIEGQSDVPVPAAAPPRYAAMGWSEVRRLGAEGVTFGPHSVTHPILSRTDDPQAKREIEGSWTRVRAEAGDAAIPVFCYPNGRPQDFSVREARTLRGLGFTAALSTHWGYATAAGMRREPILGPYALSRFPWSDDLADLAQVASGLERLKSFVRGA